jgi:hypothetical protein
MHDLLPVELTIDLRQSPRERWHFTPAQCEEARELFRMYKADIGLSTDVSDFLVSTARELIRNEYWQEMESVAWKIGPSVSDIALCNFYYDALKVTLGSGFGCTAFAVDTSEGVLRQRSAERGAGATGHARGLLTADRAGGSPNFRGGSTRPQPISAPL